MIKVTLGQKIAENTLVDIWACIDGTWHYTRTILYGSAKHLCNAAHPERAVFPMNSTRSSLNNEGVKIWIA